MQLDYNRLKIDEKRDENSFRLHFRLFCCIICINRLMTRIKGVFDERI